MAEILRLFVSATHDLEPERAVVGRAIAELPVKIGVEIRRTPLEGGRYDDMWEQIANVDRFYFLLGGDITAPAGAEWFLAWKLERSVLPLRRTGPLSPAAQAFLRAAPVSWQRFTTSAALARLITQDLARILLNPGNRYGLTLHEIELLNRHARHSRPSPGDVPAEPGGAEGGGVLLDAGHREPLEGVPLDGAE